MGVRTVKGTDRRLSAGSATTHASVDRRVTTAPRSPPARECDHRPVTTQGPRRRWVRGPTGEHRDGNDAGRWRTIRQAALTAAGVKWRRCSGPR